MPVFEIDVRGARYQIDAPDEAAAGQAAQELASQPQHFDFVPPQNTDFDMSRSFLSGLRTAGESLMGIGGDIGEVQRGVASWVANKLGASPETQQSVGGIARYLTPFPGAQSSDDVRERVTDPQLGPTYEPKTRAGKFARTGGEFGAAAFAPGGPIRKGLMVALPAIFSETGGQLTEGTAAEPYARLAGALAGGAFTAPSSISGPTRAAARDMGVRTQAMSTLVKDMQRAGRSPNEIRDALAKLGPEGAPIDLPEFQQRGQRIYAKGGEGRQTIGQFLEPRHEGANQRIRSTLDTNLGPAPIPSRVKEELKAGRKALSPEYEAAFGNARAVDTQTIANDILSARANVRGAQREALDKVYRELLIEGTDQLDPHPRALHAVRESIDGMMATETNPKVRGTLSDLRKKIDTELAAKVPGIKNVDAKYAANKRQEEAFDRGVGVLDSGRNTPRPVELADEVAAGGPDVQRRMAQGARADIDRLVGTNANDRVALNRAVKGEGDWNRAKMDILFGQDRTSPVYGRLDSEATFANTRNRVMGNSATAERLPEEAAGRFGIREAAMAGGPKGAAYGAAVRIAEKAVARLGGNRAIARDADIAKLLTTTERNQLMSALIKANGGKAVTKAQMDATIRAALLAPGVAASAQ